MKGLLLSCLIFVCLVLALVRLIVVVVGVIVVIMPSLKSYTVGLCAFGKDSDMDFMQEYHSVRMISFVMTLTKYKAELQFFTKLKMV